MIAKIEKQNITTETQIKPLKHGETEEAE